MDNTFTHVLCCRVWIPYLYEHICRVFILSVYLYSVFFFRSFPNSSTIEIELHMTLQFHVYCVVGFYTLDRKQVNRKQKRSKQYQLGFSWLLAFIATGCAIEQFKLYYKRVQSSVNLFNLSSVTFISIQKMFLFLGVLLATFIAYIFWFHYEFVHAFYLSLKISGPPALPIIGNGLLFINNTSAGMNEL